MTSINEVVHRALRPLGSPPELDLALAVALQNSGHSAIPNGDDELHEFLFGPLLEALQQLFEQHHHSARPAVEYLEREIGRWREEQRVQAEEEEPSQVRERSAVAPPPAATRRDRSRRKSSAVQSEVNEGAHRDVSS